MWCSTWWKLTKLYMKCFHQKIKSQYEQVLDLITNLYIYNVKWHHEDTIIKIQIETLQVKQPSLFHNLHDSGKKKRGGDL